MTVWLKLHCTILIIASSVYWKNIDSASLLTVVWSCIVDTIRGWNAVNDGLCSTFEA
jgi:hypothetical protein